MRLTCPTCGAEYEIADAMVPAAGRHVQCTACHTRWFVRGAAPKRDTEDEIMRRLEARSHLRAVPTPPRAPEAELAPEAAADDVSAAPPSPPAPEPDPEPAPAVGNVEPPDEEPSLPAVPVPQPAPPAAPRAVPAKPADRPMLASEGVVLRPAPRLDLAADGPAMPAREAARPSRFGRGVVLALVLFGLAIAAYVWRAEIGSGVPAASPALDAYGRWVDELRLDLEEAFDRLRGGAG